jgi:hypothetical protein
MTILIMFDQSQGYRNFKGYYKGQVLERWHREFPDAPSYDQFKNACQIEHSRHRSPISAFVHLIAGSVAYTWQENRPALSWTREKQKILNAHKQLVYV